MAVLRLVLPALLVLAAFSALHMGTDRLPTWTGFVVFVLVGLAILGWLLTRPERDQKD